MMAYTFQCDLAQRTEFEDIRIDDFHNDIVWPNTCRRAPNWRPYWIYRAIVRSTRANGVSAEKAADRMIMKTHIDKTADLFFFFVPFLVIYFVQLNFLVVI